MADPRNHSKVTMEIIRAIVVEAVRLNLSSVDFENYLLSLPRRSHPDYATPVVLIRKLLEITGG